MMRPLIVLALTLPLTATAADYPPLAPLPPVAIPADNPQTPEKIELGRQLFWDFRLSGDSSMACATCHLPERGWGDGAAHSRGYPGTKHWRNSQTILNAAHYNKLFWDGSVTSLEAQAVSAAEGAIAGNGDSSVMEMRLRFVPEYVASFRRVFGTDWPRINDAWRAIAAYQRILVSDPRRVPFDRHANGDATALTPSQIAGMALYHGKAGCIRCHHGSLASDQQFHDTGVPRHRAVEDDPLLQITHRWQQYQRGVPEGRYRGTSDDLGLYYQTKNPRDAGKFRTPSLRELKYTAPYMHNGVFLTLAEVIDFYDRGGGAGPNKSPLLRPLNLTPREKADLLAFLDALSMTDPLLDVKPRLPGGYQPLPPPTGVVP